MMHFIKEHSGSINIIFLFGSLLLASGANATLTVTKRWCMHPNKAIQSISGANPPTTISGEWEMACMAKCTPNINCMAYTFDHIVGLCKTWNHLFFEMVDQHEAISCMRGFAYKNLLKLN